MKRRNFIKTSFLFIAGSILTVNGQENKQTEGNPLESKVGKRITFEGEILHVCPVEKLKMKLRLNNGQIIKILPKDNTPFDRETWNKKRVRISGILQETKLTKEIIAKNYDTKELLCHIDYMPCLDKNWTKNQWENGNGQQILDKKNDELQEKMRKTKINYVPIFSIVAENIKLV